MARRVEPPEAFNVINASSIVVLDCCASPGALLPGSAAVSPEGGVQAAVEVAYSTIEDYSPDDKSIAVLFDDGPGHTRSDEVATLMLSDYGCRRVLQAERSDFMGRYGFLAKGVNAEYPVCPSEILEGLYLGALAACAVLEDFSITHVVSLLGYPHELNTSKCEQLWCQISDETSSDLTPVMVKALPFIASAISGGGRVLVHCEQGKSRSASVVAAFVAVKKGICMQRALDWVQHCRPLALPNHGFLLQLETGAWWSELQMQSPPHGRPSAEDLTRWIKRSFCFKHLSEFPEHEDRAEKGMASWLDDFMPDRVTAISLGEGVMDLGLALQSVFTRAECWRIIAATERHGYGRTGYPQQYRGNRRLQLDDATGAFTAAVWERIKQHVPSLLEFGHGYGKEIWKPVGCNNRFRFSKYFPGEQFGAHCDTTFTLSSSKQSFLTVNVYLNDLGKEQCGRTRFYKGRGGQSVASTGGPDCAGSLALFLQTKVLHDGERLECGLKYLMRTDVMFEKVN